MVMRKSVNDPALLSRKNQVCSVCDQILERDAVFCSRCGPPRPPEELPESDMSPYQAAIRILALLLIFSLVMIFKLNIYVSDWFGPDKESATYFLGGRNEAKLVPKAESPGDKDFQLVYEIKVPSANLRDKPSTKDSNVVAKIPKGVHVVIVKSENEWVQIKYKDKTGWLMSNLLVAKTE